MGSNSHRAADRHHTDLPPSKSKPAPALQKVINERAIEKVAEKTLLSTAPRVLTVPAGVTSLSTMEPTQSKKRPLETEARADKVAKLLASGSSSSKDSGSSNGSNSSGSGSDSQKKSATNESAAVKTIKKKQLVDLDALPPSATDGASTTYFLDTFGGTEPSNTTNNNTNNNNITQPAKRPRLEVPTRASTTKPMPASFYNNVVPGVPVRPAEPKRPTPPSAAPAAPVPSGPVQPPSGPAVSVQTAGNVSPRPVGSLGAPVNMSAASTPSYIADRSDVGDAWGVGAVHQHAPRYPDEHRRSASRESDHRDRPMHSTENQSWQNNDSRQPSVESRNFARDPSWDRGSNSSSFDSRPAERANQELVEGHSVCGYCRGLSKLGSCNNSKHVHGQKLFIFRLKDRGRDGPSRMECEAFRSRSAERDTKDSRGDYHDRERQNRPEAGGRGKRDRSDSRDRNDRRGDRGSGARDRTDRADLRDGAETHEVCSFCRSRVKKAACRSYKHQDGMLVRCLPKPSYEVPRSDDFISDKSPRYEESNRATLREPSAVPPMAAQANVLPVTQTAVADGAGRGRGRNSTLPAWMTMTAPSTTTGDLVGKSGTIQTSHHTTGSSAHPTSDARQFADAPGTTRQTGGAVTKAGTTEMVGDDHTLVDSDAELDSLLGVDSDEEMIKMAKKNSTKANSSVAGWPSQSITTGKGVVTHNKRMAGGPDSDTESGELSDDSAAETPTPPPQPTPQATNSEALQSGTIKFPSQSMSAPNDMRILSPSPAPKISTPSVVSAPPPKPSRFAGDSNFRVTATPIVQAPRASVNVTTAPQLNVPAAMIPAVVVPVVQTTPAVTTKTPSLPVPTLTPSVTPTAPTAAPKASRFATDGNFKVTPILPRASVYPSAPVTSVASVTAVAPAAAASRSTLSIFKAAVSAAAASEAPSASLKSVPAPTLDIPTHIRAPSSELAQSPPASSDSVGRSSSSPIIIDLENSTELSKKVVVKDEMSLERSKYAKKQHSPQRSAPEDRSSGPDRSLAVGKPTTSIGGKWGALMAKPTSAVSPRPVDGVNSPASDATLINNVEVVRLGMREDDPKKRLALSNRHTGGVYTASPRGPGAPTTSIGAPVSEPAAPVYSEEMTYAPAVIDLKAKPVKSILRADSGSQGKSTMSASTGGAAVNVVSKKVGWMDTVEGGQLQYVRYIDKAVYTSDLVEEAPCVIQLPFLPDGNGGIKVLWNDNDGSQSP